MKFKSVDLEGGRDLSHLSWQIELVLHWENVVQRSKVSTRMVVE